MEIKKLKKLNILLTEYQGEIPFSDSDKSSIAIAITSIRCKINKFYWRKNHKKMVEEIAEGGPYL